MSSKCVVVHIRPQMPSIRALLPVRNISGRVGFRVTHSLTFLVNIFQAMYVIRREAPKLYNGA